MIQTKGKIPEINFHEVNAQIEKGKKIVEKLEKNLKHEGKLNYAEIVKENEYLRGIVASQTKFINDLQKIINKCVKK